MLVCVCGAKMIWNSDFSFGDYGFDEDGVVSHYVCPNEKCGCLIDLYIPDRVCDDNEVNVYPKTSNGGDSDE